MKKRLFAVGIISVVPLVLSAAVPEPGQMRGPFPIVSMTYFENGAIDYDSIAKQVRWADSWGCRGIIFGQSNDAVDLLSDDEKIRGFDVCVAAAEGLSITVGLGVNGTNTAHMLHLAREAEKVAQAHSVTKVCLVSRPPDDAKTAEAVEAAWDALGAIVRRPVIMQTHGAKGVAEPTVESMVRLAKKYPLAFGYIKEESAGDNANVRMIAENAEKPAIKSVFAGWGGWQWLHQLRQCGSAGLITERVAYAPILGCIWRLHEAGEKGTRLAAAYAMYRLLIDQRNFPAGLRGYSLYLLQKEGLAKTLVSREYKNKEVTEGGTFGSASDGWKLCSVDLTDRQKMELDLLLDDMFAFVREKPILRRPDLVPGAGVVIDNTPTRVQTTLNPGLKPVGTLRPKSLPEVRASRWTLDCAGTDREHADWRAVRGYVEPLGIARIRQQAGWARIEKDPGVYDFAWLDQVVLDAKRMGVDTWMELSYGNPCYPGGGGRNLSAGLPKSQEGLAAWYRWVEAMVEHYDGVVNDWCIWNEPNNKHGNNDPLFATEFAIRTAEIIRAKNPRAKIAAFALNKADRTWIEPFVKEVKRRGTEDLFDTIAYHHYNLNPDDGYERVEDCRAVVQAHTPNIRLWEGEGGGESEWCPTAGFSRQHWSELMQAKYDLRRALGDLGHGDDTSVFHLCDLEYRVSPTHRGTCRFGLVKTSGQADGYRVLKVKDAYYAVQNAVSVFNDDLVCLDRRTTSKLMGLKRGVVYDWQDRRTGTKVVVFWDASGRPADENATLAAEVSVNAVPFEEPVWVDLVTGNAYGIGPERIRRDGDVTIYSVPVYDAPTFITSRKLLTLDQSFFVQGGCVCAPTDRW